MSRKALWRDSNLVGTASAPSAAAKAGLSVKRRNATRAVVEGSSKVPGLGNIDQLDPETLRAVDAVAIALYRTSNEGQVVPQPDEFVLRLAQLGWVISRVPHAE